jgi:membrane protein YqaA with SNARE-associated domain
MGRVQTMPRGEAFAVAVIALVVGGAVGVALGYAARRPVPVRCASTLRVEATASGEWTLTCEGGR